VARFFNINVYHWPLARPDRHPPFRPDGRHQKLLGQPQSLIMRNVLVVCTGYPQLNLN